MAEPVAVYIYTQYNSRPRLLEPIPVTNIPRLYEGSCSSVRMARRFFVFSISQPHRTCLLPRRPFFLFIAVAVACLNFIFSTSTLPPPIVPLSISVDTFFYTRTIAPMTSRLEYRLGYSKPSCTVLKVIIHWRFHNSGAI